MTNTVERVEDTDKKERRIKVGDILEFKRYNTSLDYYIVVRIGYQLFNLVNLRDGNIWTNCQSSIEKLISDYEHKFKIVECPLLLSREEDE